MGKYSMITLEPTMDLHLGVAHGGADILFGWQEIEIPNGTCALKQIHGTIAGINGAAANTHDIHLYFARSINGVAPTSFGTEHAAHTAAIATAYRRNILGFTFLDLSSSDDADILVGYNVLGSRTGATNENVQMAGDQHNIMLQGDSKYNSTQGFQTIWIAAAGRGTFDFGTDVDLNMAGHQAASTAPVQITTSGTDPRICFQPGDKLIGETGTVTMEVVSVDSATTMTVKDVSDQIDHQEQLVLRNPIKLHIGLEY